MNSPACVVALREEAGLGPRTLWRLLSRFGSAENILATASSVLQKVPGIGPDRAQRIVSAAERLPAVHARLASVARRGIALVTAFDAAYPARLRRLPDAPPLLYARGDLPPEDRPCIAVVGAHQASAEGLESAARWAGSLARRGVVIVSGLAAGIDAAGHRAAIEAGGLTVAVVGSGLDRIGPAENLPLARQIPRSGALLSEVPPQTPASVGRLLARNRIVVGMSDLVLIVEARINAGGTMDAAGRALKARIPLCAVRDPAFPANERLLARGAQPVPPDPDPDALISLITPPG